MSDITKKALFTNLGLVGGNAKSLKPSGIDHSDISAKRLPAKQLGAPQNNRFLNQTALLNNKANGTLNKSATSLDVSPYAHSPYVNNLGFDKDVYSSTPIASGDVSTKRAAFFDELSALEMGKDDPAEKKEPLPKPAAVPAAVPVVAKQPTSRGGPPGAQASYKKIVDDAARRKAPAELPKPATPVSPVEVKGFYSPPMSENLDLTKNGPGLTDFDYGKWDAAKSKPVQENMNPYSVYEFMTYYNKNNSTPIDQDQATRMLQQEASRRNGASGPDWKDKMNKAEGFEPPPKAPKVVESAGGSTLSQRADARKLDLVKLLDKFTNPSAEEQDALSAARREPYRDSDALRFAGGLNLLPADISDSNGPLHQGRGTGGKTPFQEGLRTSKRIEAATLAHKLLSSSKADTENTDLIFRQLPPERIKDIRDYLQTKGSDSESLAELAAFETINESYLDKLNLNLGYFTPKDKTKSIRVVDFLTDKNSNQTYEEKLKELPPSIISSLKSLPSSDISRLTYASDVVTGNREAATLANTSLPKEVMPGTRTGPEFGNNVKNLVDTLMNHQTSWSDFFETATSPFTGSWRNPTTFDSRKGMSVVAAGMESRDIEAKIKSLRQLPFSEATRAEINNLVNKHKSLEGEIGAGVDRSNLAYDAVKPFKDPSRFITNPVTSLADVASAPLMGAFPILAPVMGSIEGTVGSLKNKGIPGFNLGFPETKVMGMPLGWEVPPLTPKNEENYGKVLSMLGVLVPNPTSVVSKGVIPSKLIPKIPAAIPEQAAKVMNNLKSYPMSANPSTYYNPTRLTPGVGKEVPKIPTTQSQRAKEELKSILNPPTTPSSKYRGPWMGEAVPPNTSAIPNNVARVVDGLEDKVMSFERGSFWNPKQDLGVGKKVPEINPTPSKTPYQRTAEEITAKDTKPLSDYKGPWVDGANPLPKATIIQKAMQGASQLASTPVNIPLKALLAPTVAEITGTGVEGFNKGYAEAEAKRNAGSPAPVAAAPDGAASTSGANPAAPATSDPKPNSPATQEGMTGLQKALLAAGIGIPAILALTSAMGGSDDDEDEDEDEDEDDEESDADYKRRLRARNAYR